MGKIVLAHPANDQSNSNSTDNKFGRIVHIPPEQIPQSSENSSLQMKGNNILKVEITRSENYINTKDGDKDAKQDASSTCV